MQATYGRSIWSAAAISSFDLPAAFIYYILTCLDVCGPQLSFRTAGFVARRFKWEFPISARYLVLEYSVLE